MSALAKDERERTRFYIVHTFLFTWHAWQLFYWVFNLVCKFHAKNKIFIFFSYACVSITKWKHHETEHQIQKPACVMLQDLAENYTEGVFFVLVFFALRWLTCLKTLCRNQQQQQSCDKSPHGCGGVQRQTGTQMVCNSVVLSSERRSPSSVKPCVPARQESHLERKVELRPVTLPPPTHHSLTF